MGSSEFRNVVLDFCAAHNIPDSRFGRMAANDPGYVCALREGRVSRAKMQKRVMDWMQSYKKDSTIIQ